MDILFYGYHDSAQIWLDNLSQCLPEAKLRIWEHGDDAAADYAVVRNPTAQLLQPRPGLKAIFNLGAGVDGLLDRLKTAQITLPPSVQLIRLDDAGMALQMTEYLSHAVLHFFRDFDSYARQQQEACWRPQPSRCREAFPVGILGLGVLGQHAATALLAAGFPVRGWSRGRKQCDGVVSYAGEAELSQFLGSLSVLVNMLPLTPDTENKLNRTLFAQLPRGAYVINVARGAHLMEADLLAAIQCGHLAGARLDVCRVEPLPAEHAFWREPRISITPHISASIVPRDSVLQIAGKIRAIEAGQAVGGVVSMTQGY